MFFLDHVNESGKLLILPLMLLRGVFDVCVEGGLDLLCCLYNVAAVDVQILDLLREIMIASGRIRTPSSKEWRSSS